MSNENRQQRAGGSGLSRRKTLGGLVGGLAFLSGCAGNDESSPSQSDSSQSDLFERVEVVDDKIVAKMDASADAYSDVDEVVHIDGSGTESRPNHTMSDESVEEWSIANDGYTYVGGTQKIVARDEFEEVVGEYTFELNPDIHVTQITPLERADPRPPQSTLDKLSDDDDHPRNQKALLAVTIENRGNGPATPRYVKTGAMDDSEFSFSDFDDSTMFIDKLDLKADDSKTYLAQKYLDGEDEENLCGPNQSYEGEFVLGLENDTKVRYPVEFSFGGEHLTDHRSGAMQYHYCSDISVELGERES